MRRITVLEAIVWRCIEDALKGNIKTANFVLGRSAAAESGEIQEFDEMSKDDREVLKAYESQIAAASKRKDNCHDAPGSSPPQGGIAKNFAIFFHRCFFISTPEPLFSRTGTSRRSPTSSSGAEGARSSG